RVALANDLNPCRDGDRAAAGHRVSRVHHQVDEHELELVRVRIHGRKASGKIGRDMDRGPERASNKVAHAGHKPRHIDAPWSKILPPREAKKALRQGGTALGALNGAIDESAHAPVGRRMLAEQVEVDENHCQEIVEVMGNTAGQLADGLHLLTLVELLLDLAA